MHLHLRYTTDGSTPTTSSAEVMVTASRIETGSTDASIGPLRAIFAPTADGVHRFLVTGHAGASTWQFKNDDFVRCHVYDWGREHRADDQQPGSPSGPAARAPARSRPSPSISTATTRGRTTGRPPAAEPQPEHSTRGIPGRGRGTKYSYIQFSTGSLGNSLSTVLNYTVQSVQLRLLNQQRWYKHRDVVGLHSSTTLGTAGYSSILDHVAINEGQPLARTLGTSAWTPFQDPPAPTPCSRRPRTSSTACSGTGNFWGGGPDNANVPAMIVTLYTLGAAMATLTGVNVIPKYVSGRCRPDSPVRA